MMLLLIIVLCVGCKEYEMFNKEKEGKVLKSEGFLSWTGAYDIDGCGFFIRIDDEEYKPENEGSIDESFKSTTAPEIEVVVEYKELNREIEKWCGDLPEPTVTKGIKVISIERK